MAIVSKVLLQLRQERNKAYSELMRLDSAIAALVKLASRDGAGRGRGARKARRRMSAAGRRRIAAAQRARWAKLKAKQAKKAA